MPKETLKRKIQQLHQELGGVDSLDQETRAGLERVLGDIEALLKKSDDQKKSEGDHQPSIRERLTDAARELEASHPKAFSLIREIANTLTQAGI